MTNLRDTIERLQNTPQKLYSEEDIAKIDTIRQLHALAKKMREALCIINSQNNSALQCFKEQDIGNAWRYIIDNYGVVGEAVAAYDEAMKG